MSTPRPPGAALRAWGLRNALFVGLVAMVAFFASRSPAFLTLANWRVISLQVAVLLIVSVAAAFLILAGHLDLSVGSTVGFTGVLAGLLMTESGWSPLAAGTLALGAGTAVGAVNGTLTTVVGLSPIIATLGMLTAVRGVTFLLKDSPVFGFPDAFQRLGNGTLAGVPLPVVLAVTVLVAGWVFLQLTPWGRYIYAIGVNREAAYLSGVPVRSLPFALYMVSGLAAGLGGVVTAARLNSAPPGTLGVGFELDVLTAVLLGGIAFSGGRGSMVGVLFGVVVLGVLQNGLALLNVPFAWQNVARGLALVMAAALDVVAVRAVQSRLGARDGPSPPAPPEEDHALAVSAAPGEKEAG